jgi:hypothetical protein
MLDENREQSENSDKLSEEARQRLKETLNQLAK